MKSDLEKFLDNPYESDPLRARGFGFKKAESPYVLKAGFSYASLLITIYDRGSKTGYIADIPAPMDSDTWDDFLDYVSNNQKDVSKLEVKLMGIPILPNLELEDGNLAEYNIENRAFVEQSLIKRGFDSENITKEYSDVDESVKVYLIYLILSNGKVKTLVKKIEVPYGYRIN